MPVAPTPDQLLPARYYALLVELLRNHGVAVASLLKRIRVDAASLNQPGALLRLDQVDALVEASLRHSGSDEPGFDLGRTIKPSNHQFLGYALMTAATLDDALSLAARYWRLLTPAFNLQLQRDAGRVQIDLVPVMRMRAPTLRFHIEAITAAFHAEIAFLLSSSVPAYDIHLPEFLASAAPSYRALAPARVAFVPLEHRGLRIVLPTAMVIRPLALADRNALKIARARCEEELSRLTARGSLPGWISLMLDQASDHQPRLQELADILHISTRTMNRRLSAESSSFRELGVRSRQRRALHLLAQGELSITRIALQLGYRDVANFTRAFTREQGMSPLAWRNRQHVDNTSTPPLTDSAAGNS